MVASLYLRQALKYVLTGEKKRKWEVQRGGHPPFSLAPSLILMHLEILVYCLPICAFRLNRFKSVLEK